MNNANVTRFSARNAREALLLVKQSFGDDAVVLSTRPAADGGVEVLAMAADGMGQIEKAAKHAPTVRAPAAPAAKKEAANAAADVGRDVEQLAMSTLSFQDYVRERMLKRRQAQRDLAAMPQPQAAAAGAEPAPQPKAKAKIDTPLWNDRVAAAPPAGPRRAPLLADIDAPQPAPAQPSYAQPSYAQPSHAQPSRAQPSHAQPSHAQPSHAQPSHAQPSHAQPSHAQHHDAARREQAMMSELRAMKGLIEDRFGALAFMEKLQTSPRRATLTQRLLDVGFSPALIRKLAESLPAEGGGGDDDIAWASSVLEQNLIAADHEPALENAGGVFALVGATGVGKTTSTAKIAAAFATQHGSANLGLITLDAYRVGAQEQLRTYGRILGVPVHTAHDRASLEDLLELLAAKKMVLIDTAGMGQRDSRTRELLEMLSQRSIQKLLVVNASAQGETIEDVMISYRAAACRGVVLSKIDEAVKLAPALDAIIRHKMRIVGVANGQRVPEDWHRLSAQALLQRALRASANRSWRLEGHEVNLVFAGVSSSAGAAGAALHA
jgi:flagellar biosynthesis protein FlhF